MSDMITGDLFSFDGKTYEPEHDQVRLTGQWLRVWNVMMDGKWRSLSEVSRITGDPEASISARLRDFRKKRFGSHEVDRIRVGDPKRGYFRYRLILNGGHLDV